jgi:hypothetical protein
MKSVRLHIWKFVFALVCLGAAALPSAPARAQAPAMHVGTFGMGAPQHCGGVNFCGISAVAALQKEGLHVDKSGPFLFFGNNQDTRVTVICTSLGGGKMAVAVVAASASSDSAEALRNKVRTTMVGSRCL